MKGGGYYQYLGNTGYSNGVTMPTVNHYLRGSHSALANPTPWTRTLAGGRCGCSRRKKRKSRARSKSRFF